MRIWLMLYVAVGIACVVAACLMIRPAPNTIGAPGAAVSRGERLERFDLLAEVHGARLPRVGDRAADFEARDEIGAPFHLVNHLDRPLLFGAFCTCRRCEETARRWSDLVRRHPTQFNVAALVSLPRGDSLFEFHDRLRVAFPLIPDPGHGLSARYPGPGAASAALGCPRAWVIGTDGRYRYVMPMAAPPSERVLAAIARALRLTGPVCPVAQSG